MKNKQQFINYTMVIFLFFLLIQQAFRLLTLNIGLDIVPMLDIKFFIVLIVVSFLFYTMLYFLTLFFIVDMYISINLYIPLKPEYNIVREYVVSTYKEVKTYQELAVIRC